MVEYFKRTTLPPVDERALRSDGIAPWRMVLAATVDMRREMTRRMIAALDSQDAAAHNAAHDSHKFAARIGNRILTSGQ